MCDTNARGGSRKGGDGGEPSLHLGWTTNIDAPLGLGCQATGQTCIHGSRWPWSGAPHNGCPHNRNARCKNVEEGDRTRSSDWGIEE